MHVPLVTSVTVVAATAHTAGVVDENDTGRPDDAVALTSTLACVSDTSASAPKVIVCGVFGIGAVTNVKSSDVVGPTPFVLVTA